MSASGKISHRWRLDVYKLSIEAGMQLFQISKKFPREEMYSLTDPVRRSSRSVSGQIVEGWRRRKYEAVFVNKLNELEGEGGEAQVWIEYTVKCEYVSAKEGRKLHRTYDRIIRKLVTMGNNPEPWLFRKRKD